MVAVEVALVQKGLELAKAVAAVVAAAVVAAMAVAMVTNEAVAAVAVMVSICIHNNISHVSFGRGRNHWARAVKPPSGGQGWKPLGMGSKALLWGGWGRAGARGRSKMSK